MTEERKIMQIIYKNFTITLPEGVYLQGDILKNFYFELKISGEDSDIKIYTTGKEYNDQTPILDLWKEEDGVVLKDEPVRFVQNGLEGCDLLYEYEGAEYCEHRFRIDADEQNRTLVLMIGGAPEAKKNGGNGILWKIMESIRKIK